MEKATFHAQLTALRERFPEGELICLKDAAQYVGIDYRTLQGDRTFPMKKMVPKTGLPQLLFCRPLNPLSWRYGKNTVRNLS